MVYGGPGVQTVLDAWSPQLLWQHLADRGFVVFQLDNRGSTGPRPGASRRPSTTHLGKVELADQLAGRRRAQPPCPSSTPRASPSTGTATAASWRRWRCSPAPDRFKVGIAGAPVTDWRLYDTGYTERYMGTPAENPAGYAASDLARMAGHLQGKLLLLHALMDENVHFDHSAHLIDALVAAEQALRSRSSSPASATATGTPRRAATPYRRVVDYLVENL